MRTFGFKHGGVVYLSDVRAKLVAEAVVQRANIYAGEPIEPEKIIERVNAEALDAMRGDYLIADLDAPTRRRVIANTHSKVVAHLTETQREALDLTPKGQGFSISFGARYTIDGWRWEKRGGHAALDKVSRLAAAIVADGWQSTNDAATSTSPDGGHVRTTTRYVKDDVVIYLNTHVGVTASENSASVWVQFAPVNAKEI